MLHFFSHYNSDNFFAQRREVKAGKATHIQAFNWRQLRTPGQLIGSAAGILASV